MLLIRAWVGESSIHGLGLIAHQFVPKGTVIWKLSPVFDIILTEEQFKNLPEAVRDCITRYGYFDGCNKRYVLCGDDDRFCNHSDDANCDFYGDYAIAARDIFPGDEITDNYASFGKSLLDGKKLDLCHENKTKV